MVGVWVASWAGQLGAYLAALMVALWDFDSAVLLAALLVVERVERWAALKADRLAAWMVASTAAKKAV